MPIRNTPSDTWRITSPAASVNLTRTSREQQTSELTAKPQARRSRLNVFLHTATRIRHLCLLTEGSLLQNLIKAATFACQTFQLSYTSDSNQRQARLRRWEHLNWRSSCKSRSCRQSECRQSEKGGGHEEIIYIGADVGFFRVCGSVNRNWNDQRGSLRNSPN